MGFSFLFDRLTIRQLSTEPPHEDVSLNGFQLWVIVPDLGGNPSDLTIYPWHAGRISISFPSPPKPAKNRASPHPVFLS